MSASLPDPSFAAAAMAGDDAAVDRLAAAWLHHVYHWCHRFGGPGIDAEDAAHEVLIVMCRKIGTVRSAEQFPSWLYGTTKKVVANHRRRAWLRRWVPGANMEREHPGQGPERAAEAKQAADQVWAALSGMRAEHREVLVLCELEEHSATEAAVLIGVPSGTVKSRLRAARRTFKAAIVRNGGRDRETAAGVG